ncbi:MAG TPA: hypothetical protein VFP94_06330 [Terriglobales bacterium]|nr:hypothetical protein [Terriglobales bacterium]
MRLRARLIVGAAVVAGAVLVGLAWWRLPPPAVRRLPEGQTVVYVNAALLRQAGALAPAAKWTGTPAPEYQAFVQESGFDYTRDLDGLAVAAMGSPSAPAEATAILNGRFAPQFTTYLRRHARRALRLDGVEAFEFPGWARPQQAITVVLLDGHTLLATNAPVAEPVVARAERGWPGAWMQAPKLWQGGSAGPRLVAYAGSDIRALAAERALDGSQPPFLGMNRLVLRAVAGGGGLEVTATADTATAADAATDSRWLGEQLQAIRPLFAAGTGPASLGALLDQVAIDQNGAQVVVNLKIPAATLQALSQH